MKKHKCHFFKAKLLDDGCMRIQFMGMNIAKFPVLSKRHVQYTPYYNPVVPLPPDEHKIFNADGTPMRTFFIRDIHFAHCPVNESKYFIWDRFNIGLNTHFYSHNSMLETMGTPERRYGMLIESEAIVPEDYKIFDKNPELAKQFDLIFTYSDRLLDTLPNARFVPFLAGVWGDLCDPELFKHKSKLCSFIASDKKLVPLHLFRYNLAMKCKKEHLCDTFGTFDGGERVKNLSDTYRDYMFCICLENDIKKYYFSERLTTALANQCIPIYLGATAIDEFFNPEGIIKITTDSDINKVLSMCTKEEYYRRLNAVLDNYERVKKFRNPFDYMYETYLNNNKTKQDKGY